MHTLALLLLLALALVCLGIPLAATAVVYREELLPIWSRIRSAVTTAAAFDPRHPALDYPVGR